MPLEVIALMGVFLLVQRQALKSEEIIAPSQVAELIYMVGIQRVMVTEILVVVRSCIKMFEGI
jgi:hypothetical protein